MTHPGSSDDPLDPVWKALAHPVRRGILDALRDAPRTTGALAELFPELSRFAVMQHLKVLEQGQLLTRSKRGRFRVHHLNPVPIQQIYHRWVRHYEANWAESLVALKASLEAPHDEESADER